MAADLSARHSLSWVLVNAIEASCKSIEFGRSRASFILVHLLGLSTQVGTQPQTGHTKSVALTWGGCC